MMIIIAITFFWMLITSGAVDTIFTNQTIGDGELVVSKTGTFELGFFSPGRSKNRYLGIWYKRIMPRTVIWVANRENPLNSTLGVFMFDRERMLLLLNGTMIWSSNFSEPITDITAVARLLDTGNFVIKGSSKEDFIWQSFDYPGNAFVPGIRFGKNHLTGKDRYLTSWRSTEDPSLGEYALRWVMDEYPQMYKMKGSIIESRMGPWNGVNFAGLPSYTQNQLSTYKMEIVTNQEEVYFTYTLNSTTVLERAILTADGRLEYAHHDLVSQAQVWMQDWTIPLDNCDSYGMCGPYGSCNTLTSPYCGCLKGFKPAEEWRPDNWDSGCQRMVALDCKPEDGFLQFPGVKLPDTKGAWFNEHMTLEECAVACKNNCSCTAYANPYITAATKGCLQWFGDLIDIRVYPQRGQDLYVRMAASELLRLQSGSNKKTQVLIKVFLPASATVVLLGMILALQGVLEGQEIAVKRLSKSSHQGLQEFKNEIICIAKLQHRNLVKLLGYCIQGNETMLIYEYLPNKSLDQFIFGLALIGLSASALSMGLLEVFFIRLDRNRRPPKTEEE